MSVATAHSTTLAISAILSQHANGHSRLYDLLSISVGRVLSKIAKGGGDWRSQVNEEKFRHIADWLRAALANNEPWLDHVDDLGRPKKLTKFGTIDRLTQEADKAMLKAAQRLSTVKLIEGDEELFEELGDGFYLVRLMTPAALDRESAEMQHCIGNGGYDDNLQRRGFLYLSLRDGAGKAHATLEIEDGMLVQLQGKQNRRPIQAYVDPLIPFIRNEGYSVAISASRLGYVIDIPGDWHNIHHLPKGLEVSGNLNLGESSVNVLPEGLKVGGNLYVHNTQIRHLPEDMKLYGLFIYLINTGICSLPDCIPDATWVYWDDEAGTAKEFRLLHNGTPHKKLVLHAKRMLQRATSPFREAMNRCGFW